MNSSSDEFTPFSSWSNYQILISIFLGILSIITVVGNSLVLYVFWRSKNLRSPAHILLANLAAADLCVGAGIMPVMATVTVYNWRWLWGDILCTASEYIHYSLCAATMFSMCAICMDRYVGVRFPLRHKTIMSTEQVVKLIVIIWILAVMMTATPLTLWPVKGVHGSFVCSVNLRPKFLFFISTCVYFIPVSVVVLIYFLLYREAMKPFNPTGNFGSQNYTTGASMSSSLSKPSVAHAGKTSVPSNAEHRFLTKRREQIKLTKRISIIVSAMILFYGPVFIILVMKGFESRWYSMNLLLIGAWIRYSCSCLNAFLYAFAVPGYKKAFLKIFWNENANSEENGMSNSDSGKGHPPKTLLAHRPDLTSPITRTVDCIYCGNLQDGITNEYNQRQPHICSECNHKFLTGQFRRVQPVDTKSPDTISAPMPKPTLPSTSNAVGIFQNVKNEPEANPPAQPIAHFQPRKSSFHNMEYPDSLVNEIQIVLNAKNKKSSNYDETRILGNQTSTLLQSLTTFTPVELRRNANRTPKDIHELRKSALMPIVERRSKMLLNPMEIDWDSIKELDEIIEKLETLIQPPDIDDNQNQNTNLEK